MTTQQLAYKSLPTIEGTEGAILPDPGKVGVWAWSTSQAKPVFWDGTKWSSGSTGGGAGVEFDTASGIIQAQRVVLSGAYHANLDPNNKTLNLNLPLSPEAFGITFNTHSNGEKTRYGHYSRVFYVPNVYQSLVATLLPSTDHDIDDLSEYTVAAQSLGINNLEICISTKGPIVGVFNVLISKTPKTYDYGFG